MMRVTYQLVRAQSVIGVSMKVGAIVFDRIERAARSRDQCDRRAKLRDRRSESEADTLARDGHQRPSSVKPETRRLRQIHDLFRGDQRLAASGVRDMPFAVASHSDIGLLTLQY